MGTIVLVVGILMVLVGIAGLFDGGNKGLAEEMEAEPGFSDAISYIDPQARNGIAISTDVPRLALGDKTGIRILNPSQVLNLKLEVDGEETTKRNVGAQLGRAVLGGVVLGPAGAIVGAMTAGSKTKSTVGSVVLHIGIDDLEEPNFRVSFLQISPPASKDRMDVKHALKLAQQWHDRLISLQKRADPSKQQIRELAEQHSLEQLEHEDAEIEDHATQLWLTNEDARSKSSNILSQATPDEVMKQYRIERVGKKFAFGDLLFDNLVEAVQAAQSGTGNNE